MRLALLLVSVLLVVIAGVSASLVGCEEYNNTITKCWNQGSIQNTTYISDNMVDISNSPDRFGWADYEDCLIRHNTHNNETTYYCVGDVGQGNFFTDNQTYWKAEYNQSIPSGFLGKKFEQDTYDDYVNRTIYWKRSGNIPPFIDLWLGFCIKDINISLNQAIDNLNFETDEYHNSIQTNDSTQYTTFNLTGGVNVADPSTEQSIAWKLDWTRQNGFSWDGNRACVMEKISINQGQSSFEWIDADPCIIASEGGPNLAGCTLTASTTTAPTTTRNITFYGKYTILCRGACSATFSTGCHGRGFENTTGVFSEMDDWLTSPLAWPRPVCGNSSYSSCQQNQITQFINPPALGGTTRAFDVICLREGKHYADMNMTTGSGTYFDCTPATNYTCPDDLKPPIVHIISPANNSDVTAGNNIITATSNDTAKHVRYPLTNMTLYSNRTGTYAKETTLSVWKNESALKEFTLNVQGVVIYSVSSCDNNDYCNTTANYTINGLAVAEPAGRKYWLLFGSLFGTLFGW